MPGTQGKGDTKAAFFHISRIVQPGFYCLGLLCLLAATQHKHCNGTDG